MKTFEKLALEVARELSEEGFSGTGTDYTLAFYPRFLAAVDAERGKDAVGYIDSAQLKRWETLRGTDFEVAERCYIPWSAIPFKSDISDCSTPVFLSPTIPQWQPIDTAPKDGSRIMLLFAGGLPEFGYWEDQRYNKNPSPYWNGDCDRVFGVRYYKINPPTHWMPLPPPPAGVTK